MKQLLATLLLILTLFTISACNVADNINENILDIEDNDEDSTNNTNDVNDNTEEPTDSSGDDIIIGGGDTTTPDTDDDSDTTDDTTTDDTTTDNTTTDDDTTTDDTEEDNDVKDFTLTFPEYSDKTSIEISMGTNERKQVLIRSTPVQEDEIIEYELISGDGVVKENLILQGEAIADRNYDYLFTMESNNTLGTDMFELFMTNSKGFSRQVTIQITVEDQLILYPPTRSIYPIVVNGDEQNISIQAKNTLGHELLFSILNLAEINAEKNIRLSVIGGTVFDSGTENGVELILSARGLAVGTADVQIKVLDTETNSAKYMVFSIESVNRNTEFKSDLYECGESSTAGYESTSDANTPTDPDGTYSSDNAIYLRSIYEMNYDTGNTFSKVILFHQTTRQEGVIYPEYGRSYITNIQTGQEIAIVHYAPHLATTSYFIKYYDEDKDSIVCEKRYFPETGTITVNELEASLDSYVNTDVQISSDGTDITSSTDSSGVVPGIPNF